MRNGDQLMNKTRFFTIGKTNYKIESGYPNCQGCDDLTTGIPEGWCCTFNGENGQGCKYAHPMVVEGLAIYLGEVHNLSKEA